MTSERVLLGVEAVTKRFGTVTAVDAVSLAIRENEFFALLGPSGCGKTTLLRMLAGFETPNEGRILLDGRDISAVPPNRRPVNLMFQSYALFPHMSVRANIAYGLEMERLPKDEIRARTDAIMATTQLSAMADRRPDQLSGGQRQRVALARALVKRPRLLLLDEPLGALDKKLRGAMQLELKRLQHEVGITFIMVTHDQEEALVMADRIAVLRDGHLLQCGTPNEIYERPSGRFVADFIGVTNFIPGRAAPGGVAAASGLLVRGARPQGLADGAEAWAAVRPERLSLFPGPQAENRTTGIVEATAYHGLDLQVHVRTALAASPLLVRVTAEQAERRPVAPGDTVEIGWAAADTRIFAKD
ncbi:MAG TPA: ABC transporter ATP-binding protein [Rhizobiales bacterium]|nr:ABC transporter ATP-binding protein [Hyphomicrobiales bacterium]